MSPGMPLYYMATFFFCSLTFVAGPNAGWWSAGAVALAVVGDVVNILIRKLVLPVDDIN